MCEQAGAIGVVMINREDALIDVPGTTDGPITTIPFAFISKTDGAILRARMDNGDDVVAFIGDDLPDLPILNRCGLSIGPSNSSSEVLSRVDYVTAHPGGEGSIREVVEIILKAKGLWNSYIKDLC